MIEIYWNNSNGIERLAFYINDFFFAFDNLKYGFVFPQNEINVMPIDCWVD